MSVMSRLSLILLLVNVNKLFSLKVKTEDNKTWEQILNVRNNGDYYSVLNDLLKYLSSLKKTSDQKEKSQSQSDETVKNCRVVNFEGIMPLSRKTGLTEEEVEWSTGQSSIHPVEGGDSLPSILTPD